ncbi:MAG: hypothetical protein QM599_02785 [Pseudoxanthomonas sp.]
MSLSLNFSVKNLWVSSCPNLLMVAALLAPISIIASALFSFTVESLMPAGYTQAGSIRAIVEENKFGVGLVVSCLLIAPVIENAICLLLVKGVMRWKSKRFWVKPLLVALTMGVIHSSIHSGVVDIRPFGVAIPFFIISSFIVNAEDKWCGYWSSVLHHSLYNSAIFLALLMPHVISRNGG